MNIKIKDIMQFKLLEDLDFTKRGGLLPVIVQDQITKNIPNVGNKLFILGQTREELGGSEYFELIDRPEYGRVPKVNLKTDKKK